MSRGLFAKPKNQKQIETMCVCAIDSYGTTAAVVKIFKTEGATQSPIVLFSASEKIQGDKLGDVMGSLRRVLEQVRSHGGNPDIISCVIGEPWVETISRKIIVKKTESFKLTQKMIDEALVRDMRALETEIRRDFPNAENISMFDSSKPIFQINGYRVSHVVNLTVPSVEILRSVSIMPSDVLAEITAAISDVFHRDAVSFYSHHHAFAHMISEEKILSLAIGGFGTQWLVIDRGVIIASESSQIGLREIEQEIKHEFSIPRTLIDSTMSFASDESLVANQQDIYYKRTLRSCQSWLHEIRASFELLRKNADLLPHVIVLSSDVSWTNALAPVVARELGSRVAVMNHLSESADVVFAHDANVKTTALAQAVAYAVFRLK